MFVSFRSCAIAAMIAAVATPALSQQKLSGPSSYESKEAIHARMRVLQDEIELLRSNDARPQLIAPRAAELEALSALLGGDMPVRVVHAGTSGLAAGQPQMQSSLALVSAPGCGGTTTTTNFAGTTGPITPVPVMGTTTFTTMVSGVGTYLWDLNLNTSITHTACADLDITLTSPSGTVVTITTDNGGTLDNVFNGTVWDDNVNDPITDKTLTNNVVATPVSPEGRVSNFRGEDPNGIWTLTVTDDTTANAGNLSAWSIDVTTLGGAPSETTTNFTRSPNLAISSVGTPLVSDSMNVSGIGTYLKEASLYIEVPHTFAGDLDITLVSPAGTIVKVITDCGVGEDNVYNGTRFDIDAPIPATDNVFTDLVVATLLAPEGSFDNFLGQDPNGTWTLNIQDDANADGGTFVRWDLDLTTIAPPAPSLATNFAGTTGALTDFSAGAPVATVYTTNVSVASTSLWDVDLNTAIAHTSCGDIDMTLTSPAGTVVTISTDNGGTLDNVFNGTLWDDNANDGAVDHVYTNNVAASPLSPEGRLDAFRGEDPNGVWTLTITDDTANDNGTVNGWSLDVTTVPAAPSEVSTTLTQSPNLPVASTNPGGATTDVMAVSGLGTSVTEIELFIQIPHTFAADLDITLTSPSGTVVPVTTDNGAGNDNVYNGTLFDADVTDPVTDHVYANNVIVPLLSPEGSFANFKGQDPNGNWTLTVVDDAAGDVGTLVRWDLTVRTCTPGPGTEYCGEGDPARTTPCPCGNAGATGNGCASSFNANGAHLTATGTVALDDVVLMGSGMNASGNCIFLKGDVSTNAGVPFGDGVRCTDGTLIRLRAKPLVGGTSSFPDSVETVTLSQRGGTPVGSGFFASYTVYYRNAAAGFCPPETFNSANGYRITW